MKYCFKKLCAFPYFMHGVMVLEVAQSLFICKVKKNKRNYNSVKKKKKREEVGWFNLVTNHD